MTHDSPAPIPTAPLSAQPSNPVLDAVAEAVARLRYGTIQLTIHEGKVVQLDVTDRLRFL